MKKIVYNGETYRSDQGIANAINSHFSTIGRDIGQSLSDTSAAASGVPSTRVDDSSAGSDGLRDLDTINSMFFSPISTNYISNIIAKMKNKSYGVDNYSAKVLKYVSDIVSPILCDIINKSISIGCFPDILKIARVTPLFKEGSTEEVNNYRPISNLPLFSKIFERVFYDQLYRYFEQKKNYFITVNLDSDVENQLYRP